jgi:hypothetical protein
MTFDAGEFWTRLMTAISERDLDSLQGMFHPEYVGDYPQSGERLRGPEAFVTQIDNYPSGPVLEQVAVDEARVVADDQRWAISPAFTVVSLASRNVFTFIARTQYPDGSWWHAINIAEIRDGRLYRMETYFAPQMEAPLLANIGVSTRG